MDGRLAGLPLTPDDVISVDPAAWNDTMRAAQGGDLDDLGDDDERAPRAS